MKQLRKNYDELIHYKLRNSSGGDLDLTNKTIVWSLINNSSQTVVEKQNALAGGSDSEIKTVSATSGIIIVYVSNEDTKSLPDTNYIAKVLVDGDMIEQEAIIFYSNEISTINKYYKSYGLESDRPTLPDNQYIGFRYYETDNERNVYWNGTSWNEEIQHTHSNFDLLETYTQTEVNISDSIDKKHSQNTDSYLGYGTTNEVSAEKLKGVSDKFDSNNQLQEVGIKDLNIGDTKLKDASVTFPKLSNAVISYIDASGGGTITNNPDDVTLEAKTGDTIGMKEDLTLLEWVKGENYQVLSITRDSLGVISSATCKFPDGSNGNLTMTNYNSLWLAYDGFNVTHTNSGKTVTQNSVTRDSFGSIITIPQLVIS